MIPDFLADLFKSASIYPWEHTWRDPLWRLVYDVLSWDIVKGSLSLVLAFGIGMFLVARIRRGLGV